MVMTQAEIQQNIELANALYLQGDYARAGAMFGDLFLEPAMHDHDQVRSIHWSYALCLHHEGRDELALQHLHAGGYTEAEYGPYLHPQHAPAGPTHGQLAERINHALRLYHDRQFDEARAVFEELLADPSLDPQVADGYRWNVVGCLAEAGYWDAAVASAQAMGRTVGDLQQDYPDAAGRQAQHLYAHAATLVQHHEWQAAAEAFAELLVHPGHAPVPDGTVHADIAQCYANLGDWELAHEHARAGGLSDADFDHQMAEAGLHPPH